MANVRIIIAFGLKERFHSHIRTLAIRTLNQLLIPARIMSIVVGDAVYLAADEVLGNVFYLFGRYAAIDGAGLYLGVFQHYCACSNNGIGADLGIVHNDGAHAHQHIIMYRASMNDGIMPDGNMIADDGLCFLIGAMYHGAVLYVHLFTDADAVHIAADNGIEPNAAVGADDHIAYDRCIRGYKTIFT